MDIKNKNIIIGVCGGIAAYKIAELVRLITKKGGCVKVMMTRHALNFIGPVTFEALSGRPVCYDLFDQTNQTNDASMKHIEWADNADALIIAPATANIIGKLANGIADDALTTLALVNTSPVLICPAMNTHMYESRPVQRNLDRLEQDGCLIVDPGEGKLACGVVGPGRLAEPEDIFDRLLYGLAPKDFSGKKILVTAGPTREMIDPVRFISNPSSGKMGYAVAGAAEKRGAAVTLVTGPTNLYDPVDVEVIKVLSAEEMARVVLERMSGYHIIIKSAAVSDYRPVDPADHKIKKEKDHPVLALEKTQDILKEAGRRKTDQIIIGFAAETENLEKNARKKLAEKNLDIIVGNLIGEPSSGFETDTNKVTLFYKDGTKESLSTMGKEEVAHVLLTRIRDLKP